MLAGHDGSYVHAVWLVASAFGVAALVALAVVYRRAARRSELEHAERVIAEHDQLSPPLPSSGRASESSSSS